MVKNVERAPNELTVIHSGEAAMQHRYAKTSYKSAADSAMRGRPSNNPIKLSVRVVTPRSCARVAPTRPAAYRVR